ncbi:LpxI family protein [Oceaniglobus ichthyenteri]|uniref:LpxI family protein n=1 Tax=Oceaniglobus ichthyenteri TaxID=2136177 RepID=UPI003B832717
MIAGQGRLPALLIERLEAVGEPPVLAELSGFKMEDRGTRPVIRFRIETLGSFIATLRDQGVDRVCFAGLIRRPPLDPALVDRATMPMVPRVMQALQQGDDAALRIVLALFEEAGLAVVAAHDVLPGLMPSPGIATQAQPDETARRDAQRGQAILAAMGRADVGQSCVVAQGQALAIEAWPGTDWTLASVAQLRGKKAGSLEMPGVPAGGIFYKAPKPGQDRRIDLPAIGPKTVRGAAAAGLSGIVIEAGGVMVIDRETVIDLADKLGLFLWVRQPE